MTEHIKPRRSVLYVPGGTLRMHEKARTCDADCVVIDLEDSVAPEAKPEARDLTVASVRAGGFGRREVAIRINPPGSPWYEEDLRAAALSGADAVLITKIERPEQIIAAETALARDGAPEAVALWAMIETARGILNCHAIADLVDTGASLRLKGLVVGTNDIGKDTRARAKADRAPIVPFLTQAILAARANGLFVLDGVFNDFSDSDGFSAECEQGRDLGFDGKTLIHPVQIHGANQVYSPSAFEIEEARLIIEAFALPANKGKGAIRLGGRMVELLHASVAARTLALAKAIGEDATRVS